MPHIRPQSTVDSALAASDSGMPDAQNAALHGVAVKTIRRWRRLYQRRGLPRGQDTSRPSVPVAAMVGLDAERVRGAARLVPRRRTHLARATRVYSLHVFNDLSYPV